MSSGVPAMFQVDPGASREEGQEGWDPPSRTEKREGDEGDVPREAESIEARRGRSEVELHAGASSEGDAENDLLVAGQEGER